MVQPIKDPISVCSFYDNTKRKTIITAVKWHGKVYKITKQGLYHTFKKGSETIHVFSVSSETISFRLLLYANSLNWFLEDTDDENFS